MPVWKISNTRAIDLDRPCVVCILNATPDSFADGGEHNSVRSAVDRVRQAIDQGADMVDIGGESTRPGALRVDDGEQIRRVVPIIEAIRGAGLDIPISIDTTRSGVARVALGAGADVMNDVSGMTEDLGMFGLAADVGCGVVLMHRLRSSELDSYSDRYEDEPEYGDVVDEVCGVLGRQRDAAVEAGVLMDRIVLDPGLGFGKSVEDNLALIDRTGEIVGLGCLVMSGLSRKSFVGRAVLGRDSEPGERVDASVGLSLTHLRAGARVFRVHDVLEHRLALDRVWGELG
ncbi:MAG: dihydropteroate synthase [Phycisphaerales bacterium]|nr:dihydropteroate synthase [Phycisphaerales bacterium]